MGRDDGRQRTEKNVAREVALRKMLRRLGLWRWQGRKVTKNPVQTASQPGPEEVRLGPVDRVGFTAKPRSRSGCVGTFRRGISIAPPRSRQRTRRTRMSMPIAHTPSTLIPPAARVAAPGATGLEGNAVFEGEKREKDLDFLLRAQRGRCAG